MLSKPSGNLIWASYIWMRIDLNIPGILYFKGNFSENRCIILI